MNEELILETLKDCKTVFDKLIAGACDGNSIINAANQCRNRIREMEALKEASG